MSVPVRRFSLICTDIDGTLLNTERQLSDETKAAFRGVDDSVRVILASSRMPSAMRHLQAELGRLYEPLICYNGGYIVHYEDDQIHEIDSTTIPLSVVKGICGLASSDVHVSLYHKDEWYAPQWDSWTERESRITKVDPVIRSNKVVISEWAGDNKGAHKVMCMGPEEEIDKLEGQLNQQFGNDIHVYRSRPSYLELAPIAVSKGLGLELLITRQYSFGMDAVIAFGDNYNDVDLLKRAGHGVAVANSRDVVLEIANEVTVDSKEDGVARVIRKYFNQGR